MTLILAYSDRLKVKCFFSNHIINNQLSNLILSQRKVFGVFLPTQEGLKVFAIEQLLSNWYGLLGYYLAQRNTNKWAACSHRVLKLGLPAEEWCPCLLEPAAYLMGSTDREGSSMLGFSCFLTSCSLAISDIIKL